MRRKKSTLKIRKRHSNSTPKLVSVFPFGTSVYMIRYLSKCEQMLVFVLALKSNCLVRVGTVSVSC